MPFKPAGKWKTKGSKERAPESAQAAKPDWPPLSPLVPVSDLTLDTVLEDQIILIRNLFTSSLCRHYVKFLSTLPLVTTPHIAKKGDALRVNDRFRVEDPIFAEHLWSSTGLKDLLTSSTKRWGGEVCGLNPCIRIYRYKKDQFFDQHCRFSFQLLVTLVVCPYQSLEITSYEPVLRWPTYECKSLEG